MTKKELFKKYMINESHSEWSETTDNWMSIEIFRLMNEGRLPTDEDTSIKYITDFLDECFDPKRINNLMRLPNFGSYYLTAKRMVYRFSDSILQEINSNSNGC